MKPPFGLAFTLAEGLFAATAAQADKYQVCVTCADGTVLIVGSPTPAVNGTAHCASKGAGAAVSVAMAQWVKLKFGTPRPVCPKLVKKIDGIKTTP